MPSKSNEYLIEQISKYSPKEAPQLQIKNDTINFIKKNPDCLYRECHEGHITASAWILHPTEDKFLLTHHKKLNLWLQLGGHADGETDPKLVALKEAQEESGIESFEFCREGIFDMDIHQIPANKKDPAHYHYDLRYLLRATTDTFTVSDESHDLKWISLEELDKINSDQSVKRMALKSHT